MKLHSVPLQLGPQFTEMLDDQVRLAGAELIQGVISGQNGDAVDAPVLGGVHIVLHVADEDGGRGVEGVFLQERTDLGALVGDAGVDPFEEGAESGGFRLVREVPRVDRGEQEGADSVGGAELEQFPGMGQGNHGILAFGESGVEPGLQLIEGYMWHEFLVEALVR